MKYLGVLLVLITLNVSCKKDLPSSPSDFVLLSVRVGAVTLNLTDASFNTSLLTDQPLVFSFSKAVDVTTGAL